MTLRRWTVRGWLPLSAAVALAGCVQSARTPVVVDCWTLDETALYRARADGMCEDALALNTLVIPPAPPPLPEWRRAVLGSGGPGGGPGAGAGTGGGSSAGRGGPGGSGRGGGGSSGGGGHGGGGHGGGGGRGGR